VEYIRAPQNVQTWSLVLDYSSKTKYAVSLCPVFDVEKFTSTKRDRERAREKRRKREITFFSICPSV